MGSLKNKKVLISGGSGFIPSHLVHRLINDGVEVGMLTKYNSVMDNIRLVDVWKKVKVIEADIRNQDSLRQVEDFKPQVIYHCAAYNHVGDSFTHVAETMDSNAKGTANLIESYNDYEKFIYISSSEVYGNQESVPFKEDMDPEPASPYGVGKYSGELYCRMKMKLQDKPVVILRPFNAFGPYQSPRAIIAELTLKCLSGDKIETTEGKQTREFNFVENLVDGFILAAENDGALGQIINLGSGREIAIKDLVKMIHKETNSTSELKIGSLPYRPTEIWRMAADNQKAQSILDWTPKVDFEEGLKKTVEWYQAFLKEYDNSESSLSRLASFIN